MRANVIRVTTKGLGENGGYFDYNPALEHGYFTQQYVAGVGAAVPMESRGQYLIQSGAFERPDLHGSRWYDSGNGRYEPDESFPDDGRGHLP